MKTLTPEQLDTMVIVAVRNGFHVTSAVEKQICPMPVFPANETPENVAAWRAEDAARNLAVYGIAEGRMVKAYAETLSAQVSAAFIRMTKAGRIREHITGFGFSTYSFLS